MKRRFFVMLALLALAAFVNAQDKISADKAIDIARSFLKENDIRSDFKLTSCSRLEFKGQPDGFVWALSMVREGSEVFSLGITSQGKLIWFEPSGGGFQKVPELDKEWRKRAVRKASGLMEKLHSKWTYEQPKEDLMRFAANSFFFPITVDGKRFVGALIGYGFQFRKDLELQRFRRDDDVPAVNTASPTVKPEAALAEAKASLEVDVKSLNATSHKFTLGEAQLVYYYQPEMPKARLCWYFQVQAEYQYPLSTKGGWFGVVVDAVTGKRIKTPTMLS